MGPWSRNFLELSHLYFFFFPGLAAQVEIPLFVLVLGSPGRQISNVVGDGREALFVLFPRT